LDWSVEQLKSCLHAPNKTYKDFANQETIYNIGAKVLKFLGKELGGKR